MPNLQAQIMDYDAVAEYTDISTKVLRKYLSIARTNRASGDKNLSDIPEPDIVIGRSPAWKQTTIDLWLEGRPGKGFGGGPKPKS